MAATTDTSWVTSGPRSSASTSAPSRWGRNERSPATRLTWCVAASRTSSSVHFFASRAPVLRRHATVPARYSAAAQPRPRAQDTKAVRQLLGSRAKPREISYQRRNAVALLHAELRGAANDRFAVGARRETGEEWQLVDHRGHFVLGNLDTMELRGPRHDSTDVLASLFTSVSRLEF